MYAIFTEAESRFYEPVATWPGDVYRETDRETEREREREKTNRKKKKDEKSERKRRRKQKEPEYKGYCGIGIITPVSLLFMIESNIK